ncbi:MAG: DUF4230 domain-containing protein [Lutibacter sp.]|uniref:DUF4230 domain-containing protein n=1 Tax=Lutibacter sp. TaxID=1925666 RepID=UPI0017AF922F|nr:DUF4230 domain-containing protein [Lutibacter sp.]MBT8318057.1 DUF4230 domain-containing protein [Lutibacter sp.]NNJ58917.1 DUF4230 domain-containing protein [Lutibacter sp.]
MELGLGIILGAVLSYWGISFFNKMKGAENIEKQSVVLIEKIKSVCKLITVEGDFAEIYHYENTKNHFLNIISSKKKAILLINAKVHIGFDLSQIKLEANNKNQEIKLTYFPSPKVLTVETEVKYYDKKDGFFNKFEAEDLTTLNKESKSFIIDKIPESGLLETANKEALDTVLMIEKLIETSGWKLNYSQLMIENQD